MKKNNINLLLMITLLGVSSCNNGTEQESVEIPNGIQLTKNGNNEEVRLLDELVYNYMKNGGDAKDLSSLKADYQKTTTLSWKLDEGNEAEQSYNIKLSLNNDLSDAMEFNTNECSLELTNLLVKTNYYWKVSTNSGLYSLTGSFSTENITPRYINVGGIGNVRDLGGWTTADGNQIVQRIIYRGTEMNNTYNIDEDGIKTMKECMKIKTDIDLRTNIEADNIDESPLGSTINYVHVPTFEGYTNVTNKKQKENYKQVFQTLANKDSYPVYFHCYLGADRTGTLATILEGLVGVSDEDRIKDYEVTSFLNEDFYRSSTDKYSFIQKNISGLYKADTYQQSIEKYLLEFVELTQDEINSIKDILTGKVEVEQGSIAYH